MKLGKIVYVFLFLWDGEGFVTGDFPRSAILNFQYLVSVSCLILIVNAQFTHFLFIFTNCIWFTWWCSPNWDTWWVTKWDLFELLHPINQNQAWILLLPPNAVFFFLQAVKKYIVQNGQWLKQLLWLSPQDSIKTQWWFNKYCHQWFLCWW